MKMAEGKKYIPHLGRDFKISEDEVQFFVIKKEDYEALVARVEALEGASV